MTKELLIKFLNDQCTKEEFKEVILWVKTGSSGRGGKDWGYQEWRDYDFEADKNLPDDEKLSALLDKIHHKINRSHTKTGIQLRVHYTTWLTRAAAILLIPVLAFLIYTLMQQPQIGRQFATLKVDSLEIIAPVGSKAFVQFSDGSEVHLNHGSKLKYPQEFSDSIREVVLTGEGYFKIAHNPGSPFIVKTRGMNIKALGTTFNVYAYPDEKFVATTLVEGKVALERTIAGAPPQPMGSMFPGQHVNYDLKTGKMDSSEGDIEKYISWKDGILVFKRESIFQIANRLSRWYSVEIEIGDEAVKSYTYTATFVDESLWYILGVLKDAAPIDYKTIPGKQLPDGSFSKQKIIIIKRS